eukprot:93354_1
MRLLVKRKDTKNSRSSSPSQINPSNQRTCKYNHSTKKIDSSSSSTYLCNDCEFKIKRHGIVYGCLRCKFYLCQPCFRKPSCQNGHVLNTIYSKRNTICSMCKYKSKK